MDVWIKSPIDVLIIDEISHLGPKNWGLWCLLVWHDCVYILF